MYIPIVFIFSIFNFLPSSNLSETINRTVICRTVFFFFMRIPVNHRMIVSLKTKSCMKKLSRMWGRFSAAPPAQLIVIVDSHCFHLALSLKIVNSFFVFRWFVVWIVGYAQMAGDSFFKTEEFCLWKDVKATFFCKFEPMIDVIFFSSLQTENNDFVGGHTDYQYFMFWDHLCFVDSYFKRMPDVFALFVKVDGMTV